MTFIAFYELISYVQLSEHSVIAPNCHERFFVQTVSEYSYSCCRHRLELYGKNGRRLTGKSRKERPTLEAALGNMRAKTGNHRRHNDFHKFSDKARDTACQTSLLAGLACSLQPFQANLARASPFQLLPVHHRQLHVTSF